MRTSFLLSVCLAVSVLDGGCAAESADEEEATEEGAASTTGSAAAAAAIAELSGTVVVFNQDVELGYQGRRAVSRSLLFERDHHLFVELHLFAADDEGARSVGPLRVVEALSRDDAERRARRKENLALFGA
jgi:hypothetical protein